MLKSWTRSWRRNDTLTDKDIRIEENSNNNDIRYGDNYDENKHHDADETISNKLIIDNILINISHYDIRRYKS